MKFINIFLISALSLIVIMAFVMLSLTFTKPEPAPVQRTIADLLADSCKEAK